MSFATERKGAIALPTLSAILSTHLLGLQDWRPSSAAYSSCGLTFYLGRLLTPVTPPTSRAGSYLSFPMASTSRTGSCLSIPMVLVVPTVSSSCRRVRSSHRRACFLIETGASTLPYPSVVFSAVSSLPRTTDRSVVCPA
jgi:hypothetical protein